MIIWRFLEYIHKVRWHVQACPKLRPAELVGARGALSASSGRMECWTCGSRSHKDTECPNILRNDQGAQALSSDVILIYEIFFFHEWRRRRVQQRLVGERCVASLVLRCVFGHSSPLGLGAPRCSGRSDAHPIGVIGARRLGDLRGSRLDGALALIIYRHPS